MAKDIINCNCTMHIYFCILWSKTQILPLVFKFIYRIWFNFASLYIYIYIYKEKIEKYCKHKHLAITIVAAIYILCVIVFSNCAPYYFKPASYFPQFKIANIIKKNNGTVLNYNSLDFGVYLLSKSKLPNTKYFCRQNFSREAFPEMYNEQEDIIRKASVDYIVMKYRDGKNFADYIACDELLQNYTEIMTDYEPVDAWHYVLLKKKKNL